MSGAQPAGLWAAKAHVWSNAMHPFLAVTKRHCEDLYGPCGQAHDVPSGCLFAPCVLLPPLLLDSLPLPPLASISIA